MSSIIFKGSATLINDGLYDSNISVAFSQWRTVRVTPSFVVSIDSPLQESMLHKKHRCLAINFLKLANQFLSAPWAIVELNATCDPLDRSVGVLLGMDTARFFFEPLAAIFPLDHGFSLQGIGLAHQGQWSIGIPFK
jgi:hypothetical protein